MIKVNEVFGPTIQGEGYGAGRHCLFVRLANCNLECNFCDTAYTWSFTEEKAESHRDGIVYDKATEIHEMTAAGVIDLLNSFWDVKKRPTVIVLSGGEPLMQSHNDELHELMNALCMTKNEIHVETAGTLLPNYVFNEYVTQYNVSPKLQHSGNRLSKRYKPEVLEYFATHRRAFWKFVVRNVDDLVEVDSLVNKHVIPIERVMIMPEGISPVTTTDRAREIASAALYRGYGISMRLHVLLWPENERGR